MEGRLVDAEYEIGPLIGKGAQGEVYKLFALEGNQRFALAIKVFPAENKSLQSFIDEVRYASVLRHPNLLKIFRSGLILPERRPYYIAEYWPGVSTLSKLQLFNKAKNIHTFIETMLKTLVYLHRSGFLHLDLKPSNILIKNQDIKSLKIIDFGSFCLLYTSPSPRDRTRSRMPSSA